MKKLTLLILLFGLFQISSQAQLIGKTVVPSFSFDLGYANRTYKSEYLSTYYNISDITTSTFLGFTPGLGYNFNKNLQAGLFFTLNFTTYKYKYSNFSNSNDTDTRKSEGYQVSPYIRYYFSTESKFSGFMEVNYGFGAFNMPDYTGNKKEYSTKIFNLKTGVQYQINSIAIDFGVNLFSVANITQGTATSTTAKFSLNAAGILIADTPLSVGIRYTL